MDRGQYIRLLLASTATPTKVIAAAKNLSLHGSAATEDSSTKDTTGNSLEYEVTGLSYEITGSALVLTDNDTLASGVNTLSEFITRFGSSMYWRIAQVGGSNNRTIGTVIAQGTAIITNLQVQSQVKQNVNYSFTLKGKGLMALPTTTTETEST